MAREAKQNRTAAQAARGVLGAHTSWLRRRVGGPAREVLRRLDPLIGRIDFAGTTISLAQRWGLSPRVVERALAELATTSPLFRRAGGGWIIPTRAVFRAGRAEVASAGRPKDRGAAVARWIAAAFAPPEQSARPTIAAWARGLLARLPAAHVGLRWCVALLGRHPDAARGATVSAAVRALVVAAGMTIRARDVETLARAIEVLVDRRAVERTGDGWRPVAELAPHPALERFGLRASDDPRPATVRQAKALELRGVPRAPELSIAEARAVMFALKSRRSATVRPLPERDDGYFDRLTAWCAEPDDEFMEAA